MKYQYFLLIPVFLFMVEIGHGADFRLPAKETLDRFSLELARENYTAARAAISPLRQSKEDSLWWQSWADLLEVSTLVFEQADYGDTTGLGRYLLLADSARSRFDRFLEQAESSPDSAAVLFALGTLEGFEATRLDQAGKSLKAFGPARRSTRALRTAYTLDSSLVDAALGFSLYDYWTSSVLRPLLWTPLASDRRPEAIERIRMVSEKGLYARYLAAAYLAWILVEENRLEEAIDIAEAYIASLGEVRSFLEPCAKAYFLRENYPKSRDRYERLLQSIRNAPVRNRVREIGVLHRLAQITMAEKDWTGVVRYADQALNMTLNEEDRQRKKVDLNRLKKYRKKAVGRKSKADEKK